MGKFNKEMMDIYQIAERCYDDPFYLFRKVKKNNIKIKSIHNLYIDSKDKTPLTL